MKCELVGSDAFQKAVKTSVQPLLGTIWKVSALLVQLIIYISLSFYIVQLMCCIIFANRAHLATPFVFLTSFCSCDDRRVRKGNSTSFTNTTPLSEIDDVGHWTSNRTLHIHSQNSRHSGWGYGHVIHTPHERLGACVRACLLVILSWPSYHDAFLKCLLEGK